MTKEDIIKSFDPSQPGLADNSIYGLPFSAEQSEIIAIPIPWEVTCSYGGGTADGPAAILEASYQVDLMHQEFPELWKLGIYMEEIPENIYRQSAELKKKAEPIIKALEAGNNLKDLPDLLKSQNEINRECEKMSQWVEEKTSYWINQGKKVVLIGGDHSTPLGYLKALAKIHQDFGILHMDAHIDFRVHYEGFLQSHASIMYNALKISQISKFVMVGIRDFCEEEISVATNEGERVKIHTNNDIRYASFSGETWRQRCEKIITALPQKVYISFDIDGLLPWYCPHTGTPVPGGFSFEEATYLISLLAESGKEIIGCDLVEVSPGEDDWDGNVGARLLFHLCGAMAKSNKMQTGEKVKL
ncbi:MAG: agmatinase family protein [Flavobacteriales bacterium]